MAESHESNLIHSVTHQDDEDYLPGGHSRPTSQRQQQRPQHGQGQATGEGGRARLLPGAPASCLPSLLPRGPR